MLGIEWVWWLIGTLGIGGTIAAVIFVPSFAVPILQGLARFLIGTRVGVAILAASITFVVADVHRSRLDQEAIEQQEAAFKQAQKERDDRIARETRDQVTKEITDAAAVDTKIDQDVKEFHDAVAPIPHVSGEAGNPFLVGDNACRLRRIAGLPECGSEGDKGVSKTHAASGAAGHFGGLRLPRSGVSVTRENQ